MLCSNVGQTWYISLKVLEASRSGASRASLWCCSAWDETWSIQQLFYLELKQKYHPKQPFVVPPIDWTDLEHARIQRRHLRQSGVNGLKKSDGVSAKSQCFKQYIVFSLDFKLAWQSSFNEHVIIMMMITTWWWGVTFPVVLPVLLVAPNRGSFCSAFGRENGNWKNTHWSNCRTW